MPNTKREADDRPVAERGCTNPGCEVCAALAYEGDADRDRAHRLVAAVDELLRRPRTDWPRWQPFARRVKLADGLWYDRGHVAQHLADITAEL